MTSKFSKIHHSSTISRSVNLLMELLGLVQIKISFSVVFCWETRKDPKNTTLSGEKLCGSKGNTKANAPANRIKPPLTYTRTVVIRSVYNAMIDNCKNARRSSEWMSDQPSRGLRLQGTEIKSWERLVETHGMDIHVPKLQRVSWQWQTICSWFLCLWQEISLERLHTEHHT